MNTRCPPKHVLSATRFFTLSRLTVQLPQSYSIGGQRSSGQLTSKPAGARPDYRGRWCACFGTSVLCAHGAWCSWCSWCSVHSVRVAPAVLSVYIVQCGPHSAHSDDNAAGRGQQPVNIRLSVMAVTRRVNLLDTSSIQGEWGWLSYPAHGCCRERAAARQYSPVSHGSDTESESLRYIVDPGGVGLAVISCTRVNLLDTSSIQGEWGWLSYPAHGEFKHVKGKELKALTYAQAHTEKYQ
ncbi:UNVERIFIED_CONTAM: hypothetical protein FKN15_073980 [Acipenser sinensis]